MDAKQLTNTVSKMAYGMGVMTLSNGYQLYCSGGLVRVDMADGSGKSYKIGTISAGVHFNADHTDPTMARFAPLYSEFHAAALKGKTHKALKVINFK